jgi:hypothetical protein
MRSAGAKELASFIWPMLLSFSDSMSILCGTGVGRHLRLRRWSRFPALLLAAFLVVCVYAGLGATVAHAGIPVPAEEVPVPAAEPVVPDDSQVASTDQSEVASTDQSASSNASATQQQPVNVVVSVRINSPGDDGPISQTNVVAGVSDAANAASTTQDGSASEGAEGSTDQGASTSQQAGSTATATQQGAQNVIVVVRINSPGDNGSISQANVDVAVSNAGNASTTAQGGTESAATTPVAEPKPQQPAREPARAAKRRPARDPASVAPRKREPAAGLAASTPAATAPGSSYGSAAPSATPPTGVIPRTAQAPASERRHAKAAGRASSAGVHSTLPERLSGGAANLLDSLTPPIQPTARSGSANVSSSVVYSLLAVLAAVAAFLAWPYLSKRAQLPGPRGWRG